MSDDCDRETMPGQMSSGCSDRVYYWVSALIFVALCLSSYGGVLYNEFVEFDDNVYVTSNTATAQGFSKESWNYAWTTFDSGNWIPLTWLSYQLDAQLFAIRPGPFHATNLILHVLNVLLIFWVDANHEDAR